MIKLTTTGMGLTRPVIKLKRIRLEIFAKDRNVFDEEIVRSDQVDAVLAKYSEKLSQLELLSFESSFMIHCIWDDNGYQVFEPYTYKNARDMIPCVKLMGNNLP